MRSSGSEAPESEVLRESMRLMELMGILTFRRNTGGIPADEDRKYVKFNEPGASDLWGIHRSSGLHFEVEVKRRGGRPTYRQVNWLIELNDAGAVAFWVDNVGSLHRILLAVIGGGYRIGYLETTRTYLAKVGGRNVRLLGPSGDFDLI